MALITIETDVEYDLGDLDTYDLLEELEVRGYSIVKEEELNDLAEVFQYGEVPYVLRMFRDFLHKHTNKTLVREFTYGNSKK